MSLGTCIPDLIAAGEIPPGKAKAVSAFYEKRRAEYLRDMAQGAAEAKATADTMAWMAAEALAKARQRGMQLQAQKGWLDRMQAQAGDGPLPVAAMLRELRRIDKQQDALRSRFFSTQDALLAKHRRDVLGRLRNAGDLEPVGRALFGEAVDDLNARELADAMAATMEAARQRHVAAGGRIAKRENYGLPQRHDSMAVRQVSFEAWRDFGPMQRAGILDIETGEPAIGARREEILQAMYETIRTDGTSKGSPGAMFPGSLANRRGDPRLIQYANFDDWLEYQQRFGGGDNIYDIFVGHISGMARDIALMEAMGPNPAATLRFMQDWTRKSAMDRGTARDIDKVDGSTAKLQRTYDELTGGNKAAEDKRLALGFSALRAQQTSAKLGSALLSAVTDFSTMLVTARYDRIPVMQMLGRYVKLWNPLDDGDRRLAVRLGLVTQDWLGLSSASHRYLGEELTGEISRRVAEFVIRGQGLARHTRNGQWAFGMEFLSHLTQESDKAFGNLHPALQKTMKRYDIGEAAWDKYRATEKRIERGSDWIFPTDAKDAKVGDRVLEMVLSETDYAVIMPDVRSRTLMHSYLPKGTWIGEVGRSSFLFKGFPMAMISLHGGRMMEQSGLGGKLGYAVPLLLAMTATGALAAQLKLVAAGKDPQPMDNPAFAGKALVQGGGLGLFGDLLFNAENSYGGGIGNTLLGPFLGQTVPNFADATVGNSLRAAGMGEGDPEFLKDIALAAEKEVPGRNLWFSRMAWDRLVGDSVRELVDPEAQKAFSRMESRAFNEGTEYFWNPGAPQPERLPDFANAANGDIPE